VCLVVCFLLLVVCCRLANKDIYILHGRTATADFLPLRLLRDGILPRIFFRRNGILATATAITATAKRQRNGGDQA